MFLVVSLRKKF